MPTRDAVDRLGGGAGLGESERDALLAAAGFLPRDVTNLLSSEPVLGEVLDLLKNDEVPSEYRENMRQVLHLLAQQARFAMRTTTPPGQPVTNVAAAAATARRGAAA